jgi:hypothetical protein
VAINQQIGRMWTAGRGNSLLAADIPGWDTVTGRIIGSRSRLLSPNVHLPNAEAGRS